MSLALCVWALALVGKITPLEEIRFTSVFEQRYDYSCGIASISSLVSIYWGFETNEDELIDLLLGSNEPGWNGSITMHDLLRILERLDFIAGGFRLTYDQLVQAASMYGPLIVHLKEGEGHFALFLGEADGFTVLADPSRGCISGPMDEFLDIWSGVALAVYHPAGTLDINAIAGALRSTAGRVDMLRFWSSRR